VNYFIEKLLALLPWLNRTEGKTIANRFASSVEKGTKYCIELYQRYDKQGISADLPVIYEYYLEGFLKKHPASYLRQQGIYDQNLFSKFPVTVIGVGGIGSFAALQIASVADTSLTLYDPDTVEAHNRPNQFFLSYQEGMPKVEAIAEVIHMKNPETNVVAIDEYYTNQPLRTPVVVSGVDSMEARASIWKQVKQSPDCLFYIDGRIGADKYITYAVDLTDHEAVKQYEESLYTDEQGEDLPCTQKSTCFVGFGIGADICNLYANFVSGRPFSSQIYKSFSGETLTYVEQAGHALQPQLAERDEEGYIPEKILELRASLARQLAQEEEVEQEEVEQEESPETDEQNNVEELEYEEEFEEEVEPDPDLAEDTGTATSEQAANLCT
jgi:hypothetical protein